LARTNASQLANVILKDPSLTARLIKLANSPFYGSARGRITMVSRAVVMMGFDAVRDAALGLLLFDHMVSDDPERASDLQDAAVGALMGGILARKNAWRIVGLNKEEAFISAMFHQLGRQATLFYFPNKSKEITKRVEEGTNEERAVEQVLGVSYHELGQELAKQWDFPERLRQSMTPLPEASLKRPRTPDERLRQISGFAVELTRAAALTGKGQREKAFNALAKRFQPSFKVSVKDLSQTVDDALEQLEEYAVMMNLRPGDSSLVGNLLRASGRTAAAPESSTAGGASKQGAVASVAEAGGVGTATEAEIRETQTEGVAGKEQILLDGVAEVAASIKGRFDLNAVMMAVLETMYRGLGLYRVIFCLHDVRTKTLRARFGFGEGVDALVPDFHFPAKGGSDLFSRALQTGVDAAVPDTGDRRYRSRVPQWYQDLVGAPMFLLYPIRIKSFSAALFYGDMDEPNVAIEPKLLEQMKGLRDQAARALQLHNQSAARRR
jgi:HD-like signal output (HDOD) protein